MISVIVPIYNMEKYIKRCVDSIINQTYKNLEIILINDGSTDESLKICKEYEVKDNRIKVLNQSNQGQGVARNKGLNICKGKYISFVDSDDYIYPKMYEKMIHAIKKYDTDIAICGYSRDHGFLIKSGQNPNSNTVYNNHELMEAYINTPYITSSVCNKLYKKELWNNYRFPSARAREDIAILYRVLSSVNSAIHIGENQYVQYVRPNSTERKSFSLDKFEAINASKAKKEFLINRYSELEKYIFLDKANTYASLMQEIISSFCYFRYRNEYKELSKGLDSELKNNYELKDLNIQLYNKLNKINNRKFIYFIFCIIIGIKEWILNLLTNITFKVLTRRK